MACFRDAAGNLTYDGVYHYTYNAWNRMVAVTKAFREGGGGASAPLALGAVVQQVQYDGTGRRIVQQVTNSPPLNATYHYYYSGQSVIEVRNGSDLVLKQQVWGNLAGGYVDELVQIGMNDDPTDDDDCEVHFWALQDANYNLLGLVDENGVLVERYEYTPYGERTVYFSPGSNDTGLHAPTTTSRRWALTGGGTGNFADGHPYGLSDIGHQGLMHDEVTGNINNRARILLPRFGRFAQRDPLGQNNPGGGYQDGMSLYEYVSGNAARYNDPSGLRKITLEFNAFIPGSIGKPASEFDSGTRQYKYVGGTWFDEPGGFRWIVSTDNRGFGGGKSRVKSVATIELDDVGDLEGGNYFRTTSDETVRRRVAVFSNPRGGVVQRRREQPSQSEVVVDGEAARYGACNSRITVTASGNYPFGSGLTGLWGAAVPNVDYTVTFSLTKVGSAVAISVSGKHNKFPNYEAIVDDSNDYKFSVQRTESGIIDPGMEAGPGIINLNTSTHFRTEPNVYWNH